MMSLLYRRMQIGLFLLFAILSVVGVTSYRALLDASDRQGWVRHSNEVQVQLAKLGAAIGRAQSALRTFQLSGNEDSLREVIAERALAAQIRGRLLDLTQDNPEQLDRLGALAGIARPLSLETARNINDGVLAASLDAYRSVPAEMEQVEMFLLKRREADLQDQFRRAKYLVILGSIVGLIFIAIAAGVARNDDATAKRLKVANDERMRVMVDGVKEYAVIMLDPAGKVASWNEGAQRLSGYGAAEIIGQSFSRFYPKEDVEAGLPAKELRKAATAGRSEFERWRVRKDGTRFLAHVVLSAAHDASGTLTGFSKVTCDVSEREESEARYRGLLEAAPDAMVVVDNGGSIVLLNLQAEKQFGYPRDELIGRKITEIIPYGFAERLISDGQLTASTGALRQIGSGIELDARRKDGSEFPIEIMLSPLESPDGMLITAAIRDISARRIADGKLLSAVDDLKRSNAELEHFAYVASHDLQEPLRMVASYTQLLSKRYKGRLDSDADDFIAFAVDGSQRMQNLINDLLCYSRAGAKHGAPCEVSSEHALRVAVANLQTAIDEAQAVITHDPLPMITMDEGQLIQVFQNLIGNAVKYRGADAPRVHISATETAGKEWVFSVRDNGMGIEPQFFERIFVLFQRLHGRADFAGTGIGLAICKKVLDRLGGRIWVDSQVDRGSTFHFAVPEGIPDAQ